MKKGFLNFSLNLIKKYRSDIDEIKLDEIRYGLEAMYLTISKSIIIFGIALILGIFREMILLLLFFNILRMSGFGLHATKSWICLLSSGLVFIVLPFFSKLFVMNLYLKVILGIIAILLVFKYAPADTIKKPIISKTRREKYKFLTTLNCTLLVIISVFISDSAIANLVIFGIYIEIFLIIPFTYKLFSLSYNNYLTYNLD